MAEQNYISTPAPWQDAAPSPPASVLCRRVLKELYIGHACKANVPSLRTQAHSGREAANRALFRRFLVPVSRTIDRRNSFPLARRPRTTARWLQISSGVQSENEACLLGTPSSRRFPRAPPEHQFIKRSLHHPLPSEDNIHGRGQQGQQQLKVIAVRSGRRQVLQR